MNVLLLVSLLGCIDRAPKSSSEARKNLTFRARNQLLHLSRDLEAIGLLAPWAPEFIRYPVRRSAYWLSEQIHPPNYVQMMGCWGPSDPKYYHLEKYTLFSHWDKHIVEDDKDDPSFVYNPKDFEYY